MLDADEGSIPVLKSSKKKSKKDVVEVPSWDFNFDGLMEAAGVGGHKLLRVDVEEVRLVNRARAISYALARHNTTLAAQLGGPSEGETYGAAVRV